MATTKKIKIVLTKVGTAWDSTKQYKLHDYIVIDNSVMYICKRVDADTMVNVGHALTESDWWDKSIDLSEVESKAESAVSNAETATANAKTATTNAESATTKARDATSKAETATTNATNAVATANTALTNANTALASAEKVNATLSDDYSFAVTDRTGSTKTLSLASPADVSDMRDSVEHLNETMGPYTDRTSIILTPTTTGYVINANGAKVTKSGWAMAEFTAEKGNVYLFKPGATDGNVSVFAEAISSVETRGIDYTYTYNDDGTIATAVAIYGGKTHTYTYTWTDGIATIKEGSTIVSELPMTYTTTVGSYSPLVRLNADAELPKDGYCRYMSHFKGNSAIKVVVSYKVGAADLTMKVTRDGVLASISTQLGNLSQKEDETRNLLEEKAPRIWARILAVKDCAILIDNEIVELPAHVNVVVKDFEEIHAYASPKYHHPKYIKRLDIHATGKCKMKAFSLLSSHSKTLDNPDFEQWCCMDSVEELDTSCFDTSEMTNFQGNFRQSQSTNLTYLDVSGWDLSSAKNIYMMFAGCYKLKELDVSGFQVEKVKDHSIASVFSGCSSLTTLDVSGWNTGSVTDFGNMFYNCAKITSLNVSKFDLSNAMSTNGIFARCSNLSSITFGNGWGKNTVTCVLDLSACNECSKHQLTDATYESMLTMFDRTSAGYDPMTIYFSKTNNIPDGWTEKMVARGYNIVLK